jgi:cytochrome bd-type quinol oxidase subunit 2
MSNKASGSHVNTTIYAMILIVGALFIPLQFGFANTNTLQGIFSHVCDQTMSIIPYQSNMMSGCSIGSYQAVQNTIPEPRSNSSDTSSSDTSGAYS